MFIIVKIKLYSIFKMWHYLLIIETHILPSWIKSWLKEYFIKYIFVKAYKLNREA